MDLKDLVDVWRNSINEGKYLKIQNGKLVLDSIKSDKSLKDIFDFAISQVGCCPQHEKITLSELLRVGELQYCKYQQNINTWSRQVLKTMAFVLSYLPFVQNWLPACFSKTIQKAEIDTQTSYEQYKKCIETHLKKEEKIWAITTPLLHDIHLLKTSNDLSIDEYKKTLKKLIYNIQKIDETIFEILKDRGGFKEIIENLKSGNLALAIEENDTDILINALPYDWRSHFQSLANKELLIKYRGVMGLTATNRKGKRVLDLSTYSVANLSITPTCTKDLASFLEDLKSKKMRHFFQKIVVDLSAYSEIDYTFIENFLELKKIIPLVLLSGIEEIDFTTIESKLTSRAKKGFIEKLNTIAPDLRRIILSDKIQWSENDFRYFASFLANVKFNCEKIIPNIIQVMRLIEQQEQYKMTIVYPEHFNLKGLTFLEIKNLISLLPYCNSLELDNEDMTNSQLQELLANDCMQNLHTLILPRARLTTDILFSIMKLNKLRKLDIPALRIGSRRDFPSFSNPMQIKLFYVSALADYPEYIHKAYQGAQEWAVLYQIPLARKNVRNFLSQSIDHHSVGYWLYQNDYKNLTLQPQVKTVLADFCPYLTDDNIVEFFIRFPTIETVSLYGCPKLTNKGIQCLFEACPNLKNIDLSECPLLSPALFDNSRIFERRNCKFTFTFSNQEQAQVNSLMQRYGEKIAFIKNKLVFNDEQLESEGLEKLLDAQPLSTIKHIDVSHCSKFKTIMLRTLLEKYIEADPGIVEDRITNPQYLNLISLRMNGCDVGFQAFFKSPTEPKFIDNIHCVVLDKNKIHNKLLQAFPRIVFQEQYVPSAISIHTEELDLITPIGENISLEKRLAIELFSEEKAKSLAIQEEEIFDPTDQKFQNITISFLKTPEDSSPKTFSVNQRVLYNKSKKNRTDLRPGGMYRSTENISCINQHATPSAVQMIHQLLQNQEVVSNADWETAGHVAELIGPHIFQFSEDLYRKLIDHIYTCFQNLDFSRSQVDYDQMDEMFLQIQALGEEKLIFRYQNFLIQKYRDGLLRENQGNSIRNLAQSFSLKDLLNEITFTELRSQGWY